MDLHESAIFQFVHLNTIFPTLGVRVCVFVHCIGLCCNYGNSFVSFVDHMEILIILYTVALLLFLFLIYLIISSFYRRVVLRVSFRASETERLLCTLENVAHQIR